MTALIIYNPPVTLNGPKLQRLTYGLSMKGDGKGSIGCSLYLPSLYLKENVSGWVI